MRRVLALTTAVVMAALVLSGCSKPYPGVSVWAGTRSLHEPAQCWSYNANQGVDLAACAQALSILDKAGQIPTLTVTPGGTMGISVDVAVAKQGWVAHLGTNTLTPTTMSSTYWRFTYPQLTSLAKKNQLVIFANGPAKNSYRGVWVYNTIEKQ